jgi:hypothetical protein
MFDYGKPVRRMEGLGVHVGSDYGSMPGPLATTPRFVAYVFVMLLGPRVLASKIVYAKAWKPRLELVKTMEEMVRRELERRQRVEREMAS